jgi:hypothetical protein
MLWRSMTAWAAGRDAADPQRKSDAVDVTVVGLAATGDILTSETGDLRPLAEAAGIHVDLIPV